jgi:23S rRNA pseudouridine1911/1915/1917 synthase
MKTIPFYRNEDTDPSRTMVGVFQIVFDYFLNQKTEASEMADYLGFEPDKKGTSNKRALIAMAQAGFDLRVVGMVQQDFLQSHPDFGKMIQHENRPPTLKDIDRMLTEDRLVSVTVDTAVIAGTNGNTLHTVLILQREGDNYVIHDPGPPTRQYLRVPRQLLWKAMGGETNTNEAVGFVFKQGHNRRRLDMYVLGERPRLSRAFAAKLIDDGKVLVNGKTKKPGYKVQEGDVVSIDYDEAELDVVPDIDLPIIYEDDYCIVINKPAGVLTHAQGVLITEATVATFLRKLAPNMSGDRAGIVHRLDRATSGVIVVAKNAATLSYLQKQFADRTVSKTYIAVIEGHLKQPAAIVDMPIERNPKAPATFRVGANGKRAITKYTVIEENARASLVELNPKTGRTHQLRVHMSQLGHPIIGDPLYGKGKYGDRLYLHAHSLTITLPNGEQKTFTAPVPPEFEEYVRT